MKKLVLLFFILFTELFSEDNSLEIKGFGTLGAVYNDNKNYKFRNDTLKNDGSSGNVYYLTDSILGLQANYDINQSISFITQVIAKEDNYGEMEAVIDTAYLKYVPNDYIKFKIGKIVTPFYKNSANSNVGYSRLMIREPIEVYGQVPFHSFNGAELIYSNLIDEYFYNIQLDYGREHISIPMHSGNQTIDTDIKDIKAINFSFGTDSVELRATYMHGNTTATNASLENLFSSLRMLSRVPSLSTLALNDIANKYEYNNKDSEYYGLGLFVNQNNFILATEYAQRKVDSFYADMHGYYITLGYSIENIIPYVSYSRARMDEKPITINTGISTVDKGFNTLLAVQNLAQDTKGIGLKYSINDNLDLKFQYQRIKPIDTYGGFYLSDTYDNSKLNVYSFALDFVF